MPRHHILREYVLNPGTSRPPFSTRERELSLSPRAMGLGAVWNGLGSCLVWPTGGLFGEGCTGYLGLGEDCSAGRWTNTPCPTLARVNLHGAGCRAAAGGIAAQDPPGAGRGLEEESGMWAGCRAAVGGVWLRGTLQVQSGGWRKNLECGELYDLGSVAEGEFHLDQGV